MAETHFPNGVNIGTASGGSASFQLGGTAVVTSAAELNINKGAYTTSQIAVTGPAAVVFAAGTGLFATTGSGTITTGLGGNVASVVAGWRNVPSGGGTTIGPIAGTAVGTSGQVVFTYYDKAGVVGTAAYPFYWLATGTA